MEGAMIPNYADHSANERTFLAWVRTTVAVVGFGLAVARISNAPTQTWSEALLLVSGGAVILSAFVRMRLLHRRIAKSEQVDDSFFPIDTALTLLLSTLLVMLAVFVLHVR